MLYTDFERTLESRFGTRADLYPHATEYHRVRFEQTMVYLETDGRTGNNPMGPGHAPKRSSATFSTVAKWM